MSNSEEFIEDVVWARLTGFVDGVEGDATNIYFSEECTNPAIRGCYFDGLLAGEKARMAFDLETDKVVAVLRKGVGEDAKAK